MELQHTGALTSSRTLKYGAVKCADPFSCLFKRIHILVDVHIFTFHFVLCQISDGSKCVGLEGVMRTQPELSKGKKIDISL